MTTHLMMTGTKAGSLRRDLIYSVDAAAEPRVSGSSKVTRDGRTLTGLRKVDQPCPKVRDEQPRAQPLEVSASGRIGHIQAKVTAAVKQAGANELGVDRQPVIGAPSPPAG